MLHLKFEYKDENYGTLLNYLDKFYGLRIKYQPNHIPNSEIHFSILFEWCVRSIDRMHPLVIVHEYAIIDNKGNTTVNKENESITFHYLYPDINAGESIDK